MRRRLAWGGRGLAAVVIVAAASGKLPHLVLTQAVVSSLLTMVAAPLCLLDRGTGESRRRWSVPAFPAVVLMSVGTIGSQLPPVVALIGEGGPVTVVALVGLLLMSLAFWSVVMPPARLRGLIAAGYVVIGSMPISMPAMFLITLPRDIYTAFHAAAPSPMPALDDQTFSGFVLFVFVKVTLFVAFSCLFLSAVSEAADDERGGEGGRERRQPPALPGWVREILSGHPTVEEPQADVSREPVGAERG
ncbi:MAG: hypothetical protein QOK05_2532 [Chloroflexota bacterium]|jgi:hypothetical protein|nr:hypothetical protein [Chloroflexota bacterium]